MEKSRPRSHILVRNTLWNFLSQGWFLILAFVTTPYIIRKLGTDAYGVLSIVGVVLGYFAFLDLGLDRAVIKYVAEYYAKKDFDTIREVIGTALVIYFLMGFIGGTVIASLTAILITKVLKIPSNLINISQFIFYISALGFLINMPLSVFGSIPKALQRFDVVNKIKICFGTLQLLFTVLLLYLGYFLKQI
ncbi:oligosaccharide flippase family protein, partial [bacterium]|nr:oligosaccharide flippase family protein [bacterium]